MLTERLNFRHSDEREFLCSICGKLFKRADKLTEHVRNTHSGEREKVKAFETTEKKAMSGKKTKKKTMDKVLVSWRKREKVVKRILKICIPVRSFVFAENH